MLSKEKAQYLKGNGFPQPDFKEGQFWYGAYTGWLSVACTRLQTSKGKPALAPIGAADYSHSFEASGLVLNGEPSENIYVPTAGEILKDLGEGYGLCYCDKKGGFVCIGLSDRNESPIYYDSAEEAAYQKWIEVKSF